MKQKTDFKFTIESNFSKLSTKIDICVTKRKKNFFTTEAMVFIDEKILNCPQLFVQPYFEKIANGILCSELKNTNPENVRWFHYNPFHKPHNLGSIDNYSEVIPVLQKGKIINANWIDMKFLPHSK